MCRLFCRASSVQVQQNEALMHDGCGSIFGLLGFVWRAAFGSLCCCYFHAKIGHRDSVFAVSSLFVCQEKVHKRNHWRILPKKQVLRSIQNVVKMVFSLAWVFHGELVFETKSCIHTSGLSSPAELLNTQRQGKMARVLVATKPRISFFMRTLKLA